MNRRTTGRLWLSLAAFGLLLATPILTPARDRTFVETPERPAADNAKPSSPEPPDADAQQPSAEPQAPAQQPSQAGQQKPPDTQKDQQSAPIQNGTSKDRILFLLPNFLTLENAGNLPPLTTGQKFKTVARGTFDPVQFGYYFVLAGIGQASDDEPGYGQGAQGYGKRFGAIVADTTIENFMVGAVMPSLLKQDPRYFQKGKGPFLHRWWYALSRIVVTRGDNGHPQFNASEIVGSALAAAISTYSYHPESDRKLINLGGTWGTQVALDCFGNTMKEFWPDIRRHFHRKPAAPAASASPAAP